MKTQFKSRRIMDQLKKTIVFALVVLLNFAITACGGGIAGTGDGLNIITTAGITLPNGADSEVAAAPDNSADTGSIASPTLDQIPSTPPTLLLSIPSNLVALQERSDQNPASKPFTDQLLVISKEVDSLQAELSSNQSLVTTIDNSSYFNSSIELNNAGTHRIKWSSDHGTVSIFASNGNRILYLLQEDNNITIRRLDRASNTLFQASFHDRSENNNNSIVDAILNNNGTLSYLRAINSTDTMQSITFVQHPTDTRAEQRREIISELGVITDAQFCIASGTSNNCQADESWTVIANDDDSTNANTQYTEANSIIDTALARLSIARDQLPPEVTTAVIASTSEEIPTAEQVQCGLHSIGDSIRVYCLQPLSSDINGSLFEEILSGGEVFYQLLQSAQ